MTYERASIHAAAALVLSARAGHTNGPLYSCPENAGHWSRRPDHGCDGCREDWALLVVRTPQGHLRPDLTGAL